MCRGIPSRINNIWMLYCFKQWSEMQHHAVIVTRSKPLKNATEKLGHPPITMSRSFLIHSDENTTRKSKWFVFQVIYVGFFSSFKLQFTFKWFFKISIKNSWMVFDFQIVYIFVSFSWKINWWGCNVL